MKLVIAEKPSVAMALASVLGARTRKDGYVEGNGYIVSWCVGHLVGLCDASEYDEKYKKWRYEDLPIVPECWKHKILEGTKKQFGILKKLMRDSQVDEVICATDAGREGELIFRLVYEQAGCKKPMKRLWISSMEEQAIKDGFASLKDGSCYDSLYQSALCRAKADWLVGINASRLFSVLYNQNLKVGRVQTPTLAMIVDRNQKIKEFTKEKYYMAHIKFDDMDAVTEHFQKKEDADKVAADCAERMCEVEKDDVKEKTVRPPKLYDLTTLQREANRMFGYTAQQTLDAVQAQAGAEGTANASDGYSAAGLNSRKDVEDALTNASYKPGQSVTDAAQALKEWQDGGATAELFAQMAGELSGDAGSASNGGLYEGISKTTNFIPEFLDWCFADGRKVGDAGVIDTSYGSHVMYLDSFGDPYWKVQATNTLKNDAYTAWLAENGTTDAVTEGSGMQYVGY